MKILIVDDKKENLYLLETLLKNHTYEVVSAENGKQALEKLHSESIDIIISDILMPVMDGFSLCIECKKESRLKNIPFIFYTGTYTSSDDEKYALSLGAERFIVKPAEPDEFMKIVQNVIRKAKDKKIVPKEPTLKDEKEVYKVYSERLVRKLEHKMLDLEREIAERKEIEEQLKFSLKEKELLLREIHHRTKNNMQIISSMLFLQSFSIKDKKTVHILNECQDRIKSMALIHDRFYKTIELTNIDFKEYIETLTKDLFDRYKEDKKKIKLTLDIKDISIDIDTAIPLGLIINELVTNTLKHAFEGKEEGEVFVSLKDIDEERLELRVIDNGIGLPESIDEERLELRVTDDGIGLPEGIALDNSENFGLQIVVLLVEKQLHGKIDLQRNGGTEFQITIKRKKCKKRI